MAHAPLHEQVAALERLVQANRIASAILAWAQRFGLPSWYLGAGAITQTVWNDLHGFDPTYGIKDYDIVYFDSDNLARDHEKDIEATIQRDLGHLGVKLDVTNEARVHLWYAQRFGRPIPAYNSTEHAISTWPTTASSIGTRYDQSGFVVCAPFGLFDLFSLIVRANPAIINRGVYEEKASRWSNRWPRLSVTPWPSSAGTAGTDD